MATCTPRLLTPWSLGPCPLSGSTVLPPTPALLVSLHRHVPLDPEPPGFLLSSPLTPTGRQPQACAKNPRILLLRPNGQFGAWPPGGISPRGPPRLLSALIFTTLICLVPFHLTGCPSVAPHSPLNAGAPQAFVLGPTCPPLVTSSIPQSQIPRLWGDAQAPTSPWRSDCLEGTGSSSPRKFSQCVFSEHLPRGEQSRSRAYPHVSSSPSSPQNPQCLETWSQAGCFSPFHSPVSHHRVLSLNQDLSPQDLAQGRLHKYGVNK